MEKPPEPDAFPAPRLAHSIHPVIPVPGADQGKAVISNAEAPVQGARAVLEERRPLRGHAGLEVRFGLARREHRPVEKGHDLVQDGDVPRHLEVVGDGVRQPDRIVGDPRPDAPPRGRVPPVLHVALHELAARGPEQVLPGRLRAGHRKGHHVLELVAEAIGSPGLIEGRPRPYAAGQCLVEEPPVQQNIQGAVRGPHLHGAEHLVPSRRDRSQDRIEVGRPVADDQFRRLRVTRRLAEKEHDLDTLSRAELDHRLQDAAGVEARADPSRQTASSFHARRLIESAMASEEFRPVARPPRPRAREIGESHAAIKVAVPGVAGDHRSGRRIDPGDDEGRGAAAGHAEHPLDIGGHGQPPRASGLIGDGQATHLDGVLRRDELQEIERDAVGDVLEPAVALSVSGHIGLARLANRKCRGAPQLSRLFISHVERFAGRVTHRIVGPRSELVLAAVDRPGEPGTRLGDLEAKDRIGDHVDPGGRRLLSVPENGHVFPPIRGKAAEAIEEFELKSPEA